MGVDAMSSIDIFFAGADAISSRENPFCLGADAMSSIDIFLKDLVAISSKVKGIITPVAQLKRL
jgi:hypothetical protein